MQKTRTPTNVEKPPQTNQSTLKSPPKKNHPSSRQPPPAAVAPLAEKKNPANQRTRRNRSAVLDSFALLSPHARKGERRHRLHTHTHTHLPALAPPGRLTPCTQPAAAPGWGLISPHRLRRSENRAAAADAAARVCVCVCCSPQSRRLASPRARKNAHPEDTPATPPSAPQPSLHLCPVQERRSHRPRDTQPAAPITASAGASEVRIAHRPAQPPNEKTNSRTASVQSSTVPPRGCVPGRESQCARAAGGAGQQTAPASSSARAHGYHGRRRGDGRGAALRARLAAR